MHQPTLQEDGNFSYKIQMGAQVAQNR